MKKLYVGGLPFTYDEQQLKQLFLPHGEVVSCKIIFDRQTGQSKGFGFVEMNHEEEAQKARAEVDGLDILGRTLKVNDAVSRDRELSPEGRYFGRSGYSESGQAGSS